MGGQEHATLHLLYARFWHKVLYEIGVVPKADAEQLKLAQGRDVYAEPFQQLVHQGMILGPDGEKMSKSRGNVISPDTIVDEHGADVLRVYEMFMGPLNATKPWDNDKVMGISRFLNRVYTLVRNFIEVNERQNSFSSSTTASPACTTRADVLMNDAIVKVTADIEVTAFNTAISALMIYSNGLQKEVRAETSSTEAPSAEFPTVRHLEVLTILLSPFAPHIAEECYELLQQHRFKVENRPGEYNSIFSGGLAKVPWPLVDSTTVAKGSLDGSGDDGSLMSVSVRVNGKFKCDIQVDRAWLTAFNDSDNAADLLLPLALADPAVLDTVVRLVQRKGESIAFADEAVAKVKRTVFVSNKGLLNIVV